MEYLILTAVINEDSLEVEGKRTKYGSGTIFVT